MVALIDEARCIGCARCLEACPFDAIVGASGYMHTVVAPWCTGCRLCLPPCPVDCIALPAPRGPWTVALARAAAQRARRRKLRRSRRFTARAADPQRRRAILAAAIGRKRGK